MPTEPVQIRALMIVAASVLGFAAAFVFLGFLPAVAICIASAMLIDGRAGWRVTLVLSIGAMLTTWALFIVTLRLPLPIIKVPFWNTF